MKCRPFYIMSPVEVDCFLYFRIFLLHSFSLTKRDFYLKKRDIAVYGDISIRIKVSAETKLENEINQELQQLKKLDNEINQELQQLKKLDA